MECSKMRTARTELNSYAARIAANVEYALGSWACGAGEVAQEGEETVQARVLLRGVCAELALAIVRPVVAVNRPGVAGRRAAARGRHGRRVGDSGGRVGQSQRQRRAGNAAGGGAETRNMKCVCPTLAGATPATASRAQDAACGGQEQPAQGRALRAVDSGGGAGGGCVGPEWQHAGAVPGRWGRVRRGTAPVGARARGLLRTGLPRHAAAGRLRSTPPSCFSSLFFHPMPPESDAAPTPGHTVSGPTLRPPGWRQPSSSSAGSSRDRNRSPSAITIDADMGGRLDRPATAAPDGRRPPSRGRQASNATGVASSLRTPTASTSRSACNDLRRRSAVRPEDTSECGAHEPEPFVPPLIAEIKPEPGVPPIPWLPFAVVNCIVFGEFLISGVAGPFLFSMIYDLEPSINDTDAATWAGVIAAGFFFAQFLTSLLWSAVADRYGRRVVLLTSAFGSTISVALYGVSPSLGFALAMRLTQGFFNGAVGVAKGAVRYACTFADRGPLSKLT